LAGTGKDKRAPAGVLGRVFGVVLAQTTGMKKYLQNRLVRIGLVLIGVGWSPLFTIIVLADIGCGPTRTPIRSGPVSCFSSPRACCRLSIDRNRPGETRSQPAWSCCELSVYCADATTRIRRQRKDRQ
jgi:hypothetical protein